MSEEEAWRVHQQEETWDHLPSSEKKGLRSEVRRIATLEEEMDDPFHQEGEAWRELLKET